MGMVGNGHSPAAVDIHTPLYRSQPLLPCVVLYLQTGPTSCFLVYTLALAAASSAQYTLLGPSILRRILPRPKTGWHLPAIGTP
jgi:hypothetical protein